MLNLTMFCHPSNTSITHVNMGTATPRTWNAAQRFIRTRTSNRLYTNTLCQFCYVRNELLFL